MIRIFTTTLLIICCTLPGLATAAPTSDRRSVSVSAFANFSAAVSSSTTLGKTIIVDKPVTVNNKTVTGRSIRVVEGGKFNVASGKTLTLPHLEAGLYQIFTGTGAVKGLKSAYPEWFGTGITGLQGAASALSAGGVVEIQKDASALRGKVTIANSGVTVRGVGGKKTLAWATLGTGVSVGSFGTGTAAFEVTGQNVTFENLSLVGPSVAAYSANADGIVMIGTSSGKRKRGLSLRDVEISRFGSYGIFAQFVDDIVLDKLHSHNNGHSGASFLSCDRGKMTRSHIHDIAPGTSGSMYGISLTHHSAGYSSDANRGTKQATHPFCSNWLIDGSTFENINWTGIDAHGLYDSVISNNKVYATRFGINVPTSSGDAIDYAGWGNRIIGNLVDGRKSDGTTSGYENTGEGIIVNGGKGTIHKGVVVEGNTIKYKGVVNNGHSGAISAVRAEATIANNVIENWGGNAVLFNYAPRIELSGNIVNGMVSSGDNYGRAFSITTDTPIELTMIGNKVSSLNGAAAAKVGLHAKSITRKPVLSGNDFSQASSVQMTLPRGYSK